MTQRQDDQNIEDTDRLIEDASNAARRVGGSHRFGWLLWIGGVALAVLIPLVLRVAWEGRAELEAAQVAAQDEDVDLEIEHLGRAARWRLWGFRHDERAIERLFEIGAEAEEGGPASAQLALSAYREIRRALLATRSFGVADLAGLRRANERIATLMAGQERRFGTNLSGDADPYEYHLGLLEKIPGPPVLWGNLAAFAFVAWLLATAGFVLRSLDARGRIRGKVAVRWGGASLVLLVAWAVLLRFAGSGSS